MSLTLTGLSFVLPASGQQANTQSADPPAAPAIQIARTTDDLRERILLDRIDERERRITDLEARSSSAEPAPVLATATASAAPAATPATASSAAAAQDPAPQAAATPAAPPTSSVGPIDFSGTVDGYYNLNFNHPSSPFGGKSNANETNILYNFNIPR